jgi:hypothetical protein
MQGALAGCTPCAWRRLQRALLSPLRPPPHSPAVAPTASAAAPRDPPARDAAATLHTSLFPMQPLERYPYRTVRRANPPQPWRRGVPRWQPLPPNAPPEPTPAREAADAAAAETPGGVYGLLRLARTKSLKARSICRPPAVSTCVRACAAV